MYWFYACGSALAVCWDGGRRSYSDLCCMQELFSPFGPISRIYIAYDRETGESRGFAFVNFVHRDDAARAVAKLDGHGYDNLILRVEFAAPRAERS